MSHNLHNNVYTGEVNCDSLLVRSGQTSTLPHVHNATSAANVTHVFAAAITTNAVNITATDGAGATYEIRVFDATGGIVNGETVTDAAYQYDGAKWNAVTKKVLVRANLILYQFDPEATVKLSIITVTASLADGALIFLDLVTMKAYQATTSGASAITIPTAATISNAANTGDYIGLRKTVAGVTDVHLYRYKNTQVGFIESPVEFKKFDRMVYVTDTAGANDASASFSADAVANGMTKFNGAASTIKNNYGIDFTLPGQFTGATLAHVDGAVTTLLTDANHGCIVKCAFDFTNGEAAVINLPAVVVDGFKCRIVLTAVTGGTGTLAIQTNVAANRLLGGGVIVASATFASSASAAAYPATADTSVSLTFTGAGTNCMFNQGSVIQVEGVANGTNPGYLITGYVIGLGNGTGGTIAFA